MAGGFKTATGTAVGTPQYMAPEQCTGAADLGGKEDVYALGKGKKAKQGSLGGEGKVVQDDKVVD